jgi:hypothetical protein
MDDASLFPAAGTDTSTGGDAATGAAAAAATAAVDTKPAGETTPAAVETKPEGTEAQAADTKPAAEAKPGEAKAEDKPAGAPEVYAEFKAPEGYELDAALLTDFTPKFKEWGLSQDQAQELLNMAPKLVDATIEKTTAAVLDSLGLTDRGAWPQQVREDKAIGGEKVAENVAIARRGADALFSPETKAFLTKTGLGNHPGLVRDMHRFGLTLTEDGFVHGSKTTASKGAQGFYEKSGMNP